MNDQKNAEIRALKAAQQNGIGTILFRNALARKLNLNLTESLCLTILGVKGTSTPGELCRFTGMASGAMTTLLDRLERRRFIKRRPNPDDRRGIIIELSETYGKTAGELVAGIQKDHKNLISRFSSDELDAVSRFLEGFTENMKQQAKRIDDSMPWL